jgi:hypothetical protein
LEADFELGRAPLRQLEGNLHNRDVPGRLRLRQRGSRHPS